MVSNIGPLCYIGGSRVRQNFGEEVKIGVGSGAWRRI